MTGAGERQAPSMSQEHDLAKEARKELMGAVESWALSRRDKTLDAEEHNLYTRYLAWRKLRRITGPYSRGKE